MNVDTQLEVLTSGCVDVVRRDELAARISRALATGRPLTVKVGFDPTAPDLHLGHTVVIRKMKHFQELGHRVVFVIGDFTGDDRRPDRAIEDPPAAHARGDRAQRRDLQARRSSSCSIPRRPVIDFNARWLAALGAARTGPARRHGTTSRRCSSARLPAAVRGRAAIALHEFLYPLAQAYDSVALEADVELGAPTSCST